MQQSTKHFHQQPAKDVNSINMTSQQVYQNLINPPPEDGKGAFSLNIVDVRDVALAHARALEVPEAGGERFALSNGPFFWAELRTYFSLSSLYRWIPAFPSGVLIFPLHFQRSSSIVWFAVFGHLNHPDFLAIGDEY